MKLALLVVAVAMLGSVAYSIEGDYYDYPSASEFAKRGVFDRKMD
ncbi:Protein CBR-NLP-23 [Caenorhabditis briggsae]|nr:Protein CBR-NLP-23 [Caenorhabditis briggsae]CAP23275.2 Protein CBR-NLP-23 [Caenorhabditis briggsae]